MQHITGTDKNLVDVSIVASQRAQSHACTLYFATFTPGGKSGNDRLISGPMVTHMRNGSMKAAEMEPFYILTRGEGQLAAQQSQEWGDSRGPVRH